MPGTYVPSGGIGFAWAGLVQDPNASNNNGGGSNSGSNSNSNGGSNNNSNATTLSNTGDASNLPLALSGFALIGLGTIAVIRKR